MIARGLWSRSGRNALVVVLAGALAIAACSDDAGVENAASVRPGSEPTGPETGDTTGTGAAGTAPVETPVRTFEIPGADTAPAPTTDPPRPTSGPDAVPTTEAGPTTTLAPVPLPEPAAVDRIVSLSPTHTETLFALGVGDSVVAVDAESDFPEAAVAVQKAALSAAMADIGVVRDFEPDLVIVGDDPTDVVTRLNAEGVAAWGGPMPDDVEGAFAQILEIGALVARDREAQTLVDSMRAELAALRAELPVDAGLTYFHEIDPSLFTIGPGTFFDSVYGELGLTSIAPPAGGDGFLQLTPDVLIDADPDVIVLADADCCGATPDNVAGRPGWGAISAVRDGAIAVLDGGVGERWGPRLIDLWRATAEAVRAAS